MIVIRRLTFITWLILAITGCEKNPVQTRVDADLQRGKIALAQYACHSCHVIPGITGSKVFIGPTLDGIAQRPMIAGKLPNNTANLIAWIRDPKRIDPQTAMPNMGVTEEHARQITAYLLTLK
tara:strand:+ start:18794 stop:19162 length:369 start_codon:yes stop_codon:yes gene_type:complete